MTWGVYLGLQDLHPDTESWLAEWGSVLSLSKAMGALEQGETAHLATLLPQGELEAYDTLSRWLKGHPAAECTLVYPQAELTIAQQLQQGADLNDACRQWLKQAQALVVLFRQHRRQLRLLVWPASTNTPEGEVAGQVPLPSQENTQKIEPIYLLLARQALMQDSELTETLSYLAASTRNEDQCQPVGPGLSAILERHRQEQQQQRRGQQAQAEQLHSVQEELEQAFLKRQVLEKQLDEAKAERVGLEQLLEKTQGQLKNEQAKSAGLEQEHDKLNVQWKDNEEENGLLLEQLHYVQEELERHILDRREQELILQWLRAFAIHTNCAFYKKRPTVLKEHVDLLRSSASFDADWYARTYPDVAESGIQPEVHYLKFGMLEGRNPSAGFDTRRYITAYPDIAVAGAAPLLHYIRWGKDEQRQATPQPIAEETR